MNACHCQEYYLSSFVNPSTPRKGHIEEERRTGNLTITPPLRWCMMTVVKFIKWNELISKQSTVDESPTTNQLQKYIFHNPHPDSWPLPLSATTVGASRNLSFVRIRSYIIPPMAEYCENIVPNSHTLPNGHVAENLSISWHIQPPYSPSIFLPLTVSRSSLSGQPACLPTYEPSHSHHVDVSVYSPAAVLNISSTAHIFVAAVGRAAVPGQPI